MKFGLKDSDYQLICKVIGNFPEISSVLIFGSRAMGNYKPGSDIDLALKGDVTFDTISALKASLEEDTILPYSFDLVAFAKINLELTQHIEEYGKPFYQKQIGG